VSTLESIRDAEIIVDTPIKENALENEFSPVEVEEEYFESKSTLHEIDSDGPSTDPDSDVEMWSVSRTSFVPSTTRQDREELRIVRNNFAEEYDPWDTSMVPEYAEDIFRYMRELEVYTLDQLI
jgi:hypothetical protein